MTTTLFDETLLWDGRGKYVEVHVLSQNMDVTVYIDRGKKVFSLEVLIGIFAHSYTNALISTYAEAPEIES